MFVEKAWGAEAAWKILNTILTDISVTTVRKAYPLSLFSGSDMAQKKIKHRPDKLTPIASVQNFEDFNLVLKGNSIKQIRRIEKTLIDSSKSEVFTVDGFCSYFSRVGENPAYCSRSGGDSIGEKRRVR